MNSSFALFRHDGLIGATRSLQRDSLIRDAIEWTVTDMEGVPTSRKDADRQLTTCRHVTRMLFRRVPTDEAKVTEIMKITRVTHA